MTVTILDSVHRRMRYLKDTMDNVRTSPEAHHVSVTSTTG
jgi:hypothetical protein